MFIRFTLAAVHWTRDKLDAVVDLHGSDVKGVLGPMTNDVPFGEAVFSTPIVPAFA